MTGPPFPDDGYTFCAACDHPMHWHKCGRLLCDCRNDGVTVWTNAHDPLDEIRRQWPEMAVPDDDPRVPSPWEHQRARAVGARRFDAIGLGCAVALLLAIASAVLVIAIVIAALAAIAAPRAAADPTSTAPRDLSGLRAAASGGPLPGAPSVVDPSAQPLVRGTASPVRGAPTSPAVAHVATSEGPSGPTTSMPATP